MRNYWLDKNNFDEKRLEEAKQLKKIWTKIDIIDLLNRFIPPTNKPCEGITDEATGDESKSLL